MAQGCARRGHRTQDRAVLTAKTSEWEEGEGWGPRCPEFTCVLYHSGPQPSIKLLLLSLYNCNFVAVHEL